MASTHTPTTHPDPWADLRAHTPARLALGRAGHALPTAALLDFGLAHAQARDAVHAALDTEALARGLHAEGFDTLAAHSAAPDRAAYLLRPDLGRRLDEATAHALDAMPVPEATTAPEPLLVVVLADGLSALAAERHGPPTLRAIRARMPPGWRLGPVVLARQARVALGDEIGQRLGARLVAVLLGERPGLSSPDSLGLYMTWAPRPGRHDAQRNCISNIRAEGLSPDAAAHRFWWLANEARRLGLTGIGLKDLSDAPALPPA